MDSLINDTADRIFADHVDKPLLDAAEQGEFPRGVWQIVTDAGLDQVGAADSGTTPIDAFRLLKVVGRHGVPLPLAETLIGRQLGLTDGLVTVAVDGYAPWARAADMVVAVDGDTLTASENFDVARDTNLAGEARDRVVLNAGQAIDASFDVFERLALTRIATMAGALERVLDVSLQYALERQQFGRPIAKFQAVQHNLARLAGEVAAASRAADGAIEALASPQASLTIAAGKARVGEAAGIAAEIAHQVHGAFGFTHEHVLHHFTRRLWAWRDEIGRESEWQARLGRHVASRGADHLWEFLTDVG